MHVLTSAMGIKTGEYNVDIHSIEALPGKIFSYWIRYNAEAIFKNIPQLGKDRDVKTRYIYWG